MSQQPLKNKSWFPGLNALRFFAASMVILMHSWSNQVGQGLPHLPEWPIFFKGLYAVSFFFVLSGFLITYLLLKEREKTQTISIKHFYLRRVFRIWPLYFLILIVGLFFYWTIAPKVGMEVPITYSKTTAILLYLFFLANLMNSLFEVGGIVHVTWSIAVEEQFYLFWAPLVKKFGSKLPKIIFGFSAGFLLLSILNNYNVFGLSEGWQLFLRTLQFHYMGIGAGFAWVLYHHKEKLLALPVFSSKIWQAFLTATILGFLFLYKKSQIGEAVLALPVGLLFGWLIINVSSNPKRIYHLENKILHYLGNVSYGVYMYHVPVVYAAAILFAKITVLQSNFPLYLFSYYGFVFGITILIAGISYRFLEQPILKWYQRNLVPQKKTSNNSMNASVHRTIIHVVLGKANPQRMNGVNKVVFQLASKQQEAGEDVRVWGITKDLSHNYPERPFSTELFKAYRNPFRLDPGLKKRVETLPANTIIHIHGGFIPAFYSLAMLLKKFAVPFVFTPHGAFNSIALERSSLYKKVYIFLFEQKLLKAASFIHSLGKSEVEGLNKVFPNQKSALIPYGFETEGMPVSNPAPQSFVVGFCGRLDVYTKGLNELVSGFKRFNEEVPQSALWLIGDSSEKDQLIAHAKTIGLNGHVVFFGAKYGEEKNDLLKQCHVFAAPSRNEGLPTAVLEAASMGIPCLVTEATNTGDAVRDYQAGEVISETTEEAIYQGLKKIHASLEVPTKKQIMQQNSFRMVNEAYNWNTVLDQFQQLYDKAIKGKV